VARWPLRPGDQEAVGRFALDPKVTWRNPGFEQGDDHPVVCVSWKDAVAFCDWLGQKEGGKYRLPTEAEWEYAARAGSDTIYAGGNRPETLREHGNVGDATLEAAVPGSVKPQQADRLGPADGDGFVYTAPVGRFKPNAWGLYDTHGNAWEWCADRYFDRYYQQLLEDAHKRGPYPKVAITVDPQGPDTTPQHQYGDWRSTRGGCWYTGPMASRHASRAFGEAADAFCHTGFGWSVRNPDRLMLVRRSTPLPEEVRERAPRNGDATPAPLIRSRSTGRLPTTECIAAGRAIGAAAQGRAPSGSVPVGRLLC
jgi:formylglycine-generating enzyme required for sulfatase activity